MDFMTSVPGNNLAPKRQTTFKAGSFRRDHYVRLMKGIKEWGEITTFSPANNPTESERRGEKGIKTKDLMTSLGIPLCPVARCHTHCFDS